MTNFERLLAEITPGEWTLQFTAPWANTPFLVDKDGEPIATTLHNGECKESCPHARFIALARNFLPRLFPFRSNYKYSQR